MDAAAIARPYAAAAFSYAREQGTVDAWHQALVAMAQAVTALGELAAGGALVSGAQATEVALAAADACGGADASLQRFVDLLQENDRVFALPAIAARFAQLHRDEAGIVAVRVESALPLEDTAAFDQLLQQRLGKQVQTTYVENAELLGGVRVYVADDVIDASIRGRLERLAAALGVDGART